MNKRTFKQFITEDNSTHYPWQATSNEDLLKLPGWLKYDEERYDEPGGDVVVFHDHNTGELFLSGSIRHDGFFETHDSWPTIVDAMLVEHGGKWYIPFRLKEWENDKRDNDLSLNDLKLSSFLGFPNKIDGSLTVTNCNDLTVEGCPSIIGQNFAWWNIPITNHIDKVLKEVGGTIVVPPTYLGYLSFLKIKKLKSITHTGGLSLVGTYPKAALEAKDIVNEHLSGNRNILECQEELIDAGLKDYAEL